MDIFKKFLKKAGSKIGPGIITGAADDDPSGIATYSQTGAQFGYSQLWNAVFLLPFMTAVQEACARIGAVTGKGIAAIIKEHYNRKILFFVVALLFIANAINIGADIGAMAAAAQLIFPINFVIAALFFVALILFLEIYFSYKVYARILKWLCLSLFAYLITVFLVKQPWLTLFKATFIPHIEFNFAFLFILVGVIGTTISPYMFFWEASEEVEEERKKHLIKNGQPKISSRFMRNLKWDNFLGMFFSNITTWAIIVTTATVLNSNGITNIATSSDAAKALEPLVHSFPNAGLLAKIIFATGIIGLGLLAIPVLSASASYAISEAMNWREGLNLKFKRAHGFYGAITIATIIGLVINFIGIDTIKALVVAAVVNGVVAVPLIFMIIKIAGNEKIMGEHKNKRVSSILLWIIFLFMGGSAVAMLLTMHIF